MRGRPVAPLADNETALHNQAQDAIRSGQQGMDALQYSSQWQDSLEMPHRASAGEYRSRIDEIVLW